MAYKTTVRTINRHNDAVMTFGPALIHLNAGLGDEPLDAIQDMYWMLLESLAYSMGLRHGLTDREIAEKVEQIAARFASGEFAERRLGVQL